MGLGFRVWGLGLPFTEVVRIPWLPFKEVVRICRGLALG